MAGLGTTGVLIASFFMLLTVGSTLVAFKGVPGAASNGDLSSIELRQQQEEAARSGDGLLASANILDGHRAGRLSASDDVLGRLARGSASGPGGLISESAGSTGPDGLRAGRPGTPLSERAPSSNGPAPGPISGVVTAPVESGDPADGSSGSDSGSGTDSGSGSDTGSGTDTGSGSSGGDTGTGSGDAGGSDSGSGGSDTGTGGTGGDTGGSDTGGDTGGGTVTDPVEDTTDTVGEAVGGVAGGGSQSTGDSGSAVGDLLNDATSAAGDLTSAGG